MHKIIYTEESKENLTEIFWYISDDNYFYAAKVISSIKNTIDILAVFKYKNLWE
jgi:plasmid stabilization system protein ParE